jgi:hypothetical protein
VVGILLDTVEIVSYAKLKSTKYSSPQIHQISNSFYASIGTELNFQSGDGLTIVPRNCFHIIIRILNKLLQDSNAIYTLSNPIDMSYEIMYTLCKNPLYNQELLSYIRNELPLIEKIDANGLNEQGVIKQLAQLNYYYSN